MKILITGGFGYLGGRLAQALSESGYDIYLGTRSHYDCFASWLPEAKIVQMRWEFDADLEKNCYQIDTIIHTAGMNAIDCESDPVAALEANGVYTARLLRAAIRQKVRRFIYFSTAHVYTSNFMGVITENTAIKNLHPYATSHRSGEDVVLNAHRRNEIDGIVVRLSNAFGAPTHVNANCWQLLLNDLCKQAIVTGKMVLVSSGVQYRDFVPIADVCRAIQCLLITSRKNLGNGLFNLGGESVSTVWDVACFLQQRCESILNFKPELSRMIPNKNETAYPFEYKNNRLSRIGFVPHSKKAMEIDQLLMFVKDHLTELTA